ncbi:MAG: hypothetical protein ACK4TL_11240 [Hyphomicrobiaceae bacterium]
MARFLAGLPPEEGSPLAGLARERAWLGHAAAMDSAWTNIEARQLSKIRAWTARELTTPSDVLYYFFSGPDFLYADAFFPSATTYVMAALEPSGPLPTIGRQHRGETLGYALAQLRSSLNSVLNFSFFRTREMRTTLSANTFSGTLPILYIFLARTGKTIDEVTFHDINQDGTLVAVGEGLPKGAASVAKILFKGSDGRQRTLNYVRTDLSNGGWRRSGFKAFCEALAPGDALIKSASYLLHSNGFSEVRAHLLERSKRLLQDDSGIPITFFKPDEWQLRPYGRYLGPIAVFPDNYQPQLARLFRTANPPAIDFGIGYRFRPNESNILVADKLHVRAER